MRLGLASLAALAFLASCAAPDAAPHTQSPERQTVTVSRQDITEVVAIPATVVAAPKFFLVAAKAGRISHASTSGSLAAGDVVFQVDAVGSGTMPVPGSFSKWLVPHGSSVAAGVPVAEVAYAGFGEVAALPKQDAYRILAGELTGRANIAGGPGPFDCPILQSPSAEEEQANAVVVCAIPLDVKAFDGLAGTVAVSSRQARKVLALPCTAVSGTAQIGEVAVVGADGAISIQKVELGITDGSVVEITSGLTEGTQVLATAPPLEGLP